MIDWRPLRRGGTVDKLSKGERIVMIAGAILVIDLLFLPWHSLGGALGALIEAGGGDPTRSAIQTPNAGYGILALLLAAVMVLQIALAKFSSAKLPQLPVPWSQVHFIAGVAAAGLLVLKLLVETDSLGFGAWLGVLLGCGLAFGGFTIKNESGVGGG